MDDQLLALQAEVLKLSQTFKSTMCPEPPRSKNYPLLDDDELAILLGWQDLNGYNKIIQTTFLARHILMREK